MSFFSRLTSAVKTIANAIYETSVQVYKDLVGQPANLQEEVIERSLAEPSLEPIEPVSISEGSDIQVPTTQGEELLDEISNEIGDLDFTGDVFYELVINYLNPDGTQDSVSLLITRHGRDKMIDNINKIISEQIPVGSDSGQTFWLIKDKEVISYEFIRRESRFELDIDFNRGGLFGYRHKIDNKIISNLLKKLEIYHYSDDNLPDSCFLSAIRDFVDDDLFISISEFVNGKVVAVDTFSKIVKKFPMIKFCLRTFKLKDNKYYTHTTNCGKGSIEINIGLIDKHYFKYFEINDKKTAKIIETFIPKELWGTSKPNSCHLIKLLLNNKEKYLVDLSEEQQFYNSDKKKDFQTTDIDSHTIPVEVVYKKSLDDLPVIYFDVETLTDGRHQVYHLSFGYDDLDKFKIGCINQKSEFDILNTYLGWVAYKFGEEKIGRQPNVLMLAHNSTYDTSFLLPYLFNVEMCEKDGKYVGITGCYTYSKDKKVKILIKDSHRLIPSALGKFGNMFHLEQEKEVMYYDMYNRNTIDHIKNMSKDEIESYISKYNKKSLLSKSKLDKKSRCFWDNLEKWRCINSDGTYNLLEYSSKYCDIDIKVLRNGMVEFKKILSSICEEINPFDYYSLPSIASDLLLFRGCYEDTYEFDGMLGHYFQDFIVGGRTMSADNKKFLVLGQKCTAIDWNSLYPSAMKEFDGFLKGIPKLLTDLSMDFLKTTTHYFVEIRINKVGIHRKMPLLSRIDKNGTRLWTNDMVGHTIKVDRYGLEDLIEFQKIEFEILSGYYFDEGYNTEICRLMEELYLNRIKHRAEGNSSLAEIEKLLMNSSYGKTIQKPNCKNKKIIDTNRWDKNKKEWVKDKKILDKYICKNFNKINSFKNINNIHGCSGKYVIDENTSVIENWTKVHQGIMILSYSKRLMNRAICLIEDLGFTPLYQDTDSITILLEDYDTFIEEYKKKYKLDLNGDLQGQAKTDLDVFCDCDLCVKEAMSKVKCLSGDVSNCNICKSKGEVGSKCVDRYINDCIIVGKKSYYWRMVGKCKYTGKVIVKEKTRMKGIPEECIDDYINKHNKMSRSDMRLYAEKMGYPVQCVDKYVDLHYKDGNFGLSDLYKLLYSAEFPVVFDLGCNNRIRFEKGGQQYYQTGKPILRKIWFLSREIRKEERTNQWVNGEVPCELGYSISDEEYSNYSD